MYFEFFNLNNKQNLFKFKYHILSFIFNSLNSKNKLIGPKLFMFLGDKKLSYKIIKSNKQKSII